MKRRMLALCLLALCSVAPIAQAADTLYVKDVLYITLRSGPGSQYSPVKTLKSGAVLTKLEVSEDGNYVKVTTQDGLEGWLPEQYVVDTPIAALKLEAAQSRLAKLQEQNSGLKQQLKENQQAVRELKSENRKLDAAKNKLEKENKRIREVSEQPLATAEENDQLRSQNVSMEKELIRLKQELQVLEDRSDREWFMIGAGVLGLGVLLGVVMPFFTRRKKRDGWGSI